MKFFLLQNYFVKWTLHFSKIGKIPLLWKSWYKFLNQHKNLILTTKTWIVTVSAWILRRTMSPTLKDLVWMLRSWYLRMFWRYRVDCSNVLHLISSIESCSSWRLPSASAESYISRRGDFHMMSAGNIASEPYTRKKVVWLVALLGWVRSPHITIGSSASHLPPFFLVESKIIFVKPSIISPLIVGGHYTPILGANHCH